MPREWVSPGPMTRDRADRLNGLLDQLYALLSMQEVEGCGLRVVRDPVGWYIDLTLSSLAGLTSYGTSSSASTSPPGVFSPPTLTVAGPPTWTPVTGTYPLEWDSNTSTLYAWNGSSWVSVAAGGSITFGTTSNPATPPSTQLVIPVLTVAGPPTYPGTKGEVICDGTFLYQYSGSTWVPYYPLNTSPGTTSSTSVAPTTYPIPVTLTTTGAPTFTVPEGVFIVNTTDNTIYESLGGGTFTQILTAGGGTITQGAVTFPSTSSLSTPPTGYLTLPTLTTTGTPTMTLAVGTPIYDTVDHRLWLSDGGGSFTDVTGSGTPAGSSKDVQVNNAGSFGVSGGTFTADTANGKVVIKDSGAVYTVTIAQGGAAAFNATDGTFNATIVDGSQSLLTSDGTNTCALSNGTFSMLANGPIRVGSLADGSAPNDSIYYSTTQSKLVYKDSGGTVHTLY